MTDLTVKQQRKRGVGWLAVGRVAGERCRIRSGGSAAGEQAVGAVLVLYGLSQFAAQPLAGRRTRGSPRAYASVGELDNRCSHPYQVMTSAQSTA